MKLVQIATSPPPPVKYGVDHLHELQAQPGGNLPQMNDGNLRKTNTIEGLVNAATLLPFVGPVARAALGLTKGAGAVNGAANLVNSAKLTFDAVKARVSGSTVNAAARSAESAPMGQMSAFRSQAGFIQPGSKPPPMDELSYALGTSATLGATLGFVASEVKNLSPVETAAATSIGATAAFGSAFGLLRGVAPPLDPQNPRWKIQPRAVLSGFVLPVVVVEAGAAGGSATVRSAAEFFDKIDGGPLNEHPELKRGLAVAVGTPAAIGAGMGAGALASYLAYRHPLLTLGAAAAGITTYLNKPHSSEPPSGP